MRDEQTTAGGFQHAALRDAADNLKRLKAASDKIGSKNPVFALRWLDCDPAAVMSAADNVYAAGDGTDDAKASLDNVARRLESWEGGASAAFTDHLEITAANHTKIAARCHQTGAAGRRIAHGLDGHAYTVANQATLIAQGVDPSVELILQDRVDDPHYDEAKKNVDDACQEIHSFASRHLGEISALKKELRGLSHELKLPE